MKILCLKCVHSISCFRFEKPFYVNSSNFLIEKYSAKKCTRKKTVQLPFLVNCKKIKPFQHSTQLTCRSIRLTNSGKMAILTVSPTTIVHAQIMATFLKFTFSNFIFGHWSLQHFNCLYRKNISLKSFDYNV